MKHVGWYVPCFLPNQGSGLSPQEESLKSNEMLVPKLGAFHFSIGLLLVQRQVPAPRSTHILNILESMCTSQLLSPRSFWLRSKSKAPFLKPMSKAQIKGSLLEAYVYVFNQRLSSRSLWLPPFWLPYRSARCLHPVCGLWPSRHLRYLTGQLQYIYPVIP